MRCLRVCTQVFIVLLPLFFATQATAFVNGTSQGGCCGRRIPTEAEEYRFYVGTACTPVAFDLLELIITASITAGMWMHYQRVHRNEANDEGANKHPWSKLGFSLVAMGGFTYVVLKQTIDQISQCVTTAIFSGEP